SAGMPFCAPLPLRHGGVLVAGTAAGGFRRRPPSQLSSRARHTNTTGGQWRHLSADRRQHAIAIGRYSKVSNPLRQYINQHMDEFVADLQAFLRIPSISARGGQPILDAAEWVKQRMEKAGISVQVFAIEDGHPVIYGEIKGEGDETLLIYNHYDVQPPEPLEEWHSDPFAPEIRDGILYARGVADNKGSLLSRIHAI